MKSQDGCAHDDVKTVTEPSENGLYTKIVEQVCRDCDMVFKPCLGCSDPSVGVPVFHAEPVC